MLVPPCIIHTIPFYRTLPGVICEIKKDAFYFPNSIWLYLPIEAFFDSEKNFRRVYSNVSFIFSELILVVGSSTPVVFKHLNYSYIFGRGKNLNLRLNTANFRVSEPKIQLCDLII